MKKNYPKALAVQNVVLKVTFKSLNSDYIYIKAFFFFFFIFVFFPILQVKKQLTT